MTPISRIPRPSDAPFLGVGVGLRPPHYSDVLDRAHRGELPIDWFEAISENFMVPGGRPPRVLDEVRSHAPVALHGVSLNLGSTDPLDEVYLDALDSLAHRVEPAWISDHLCWTGVGGKNLHDLLPLPYTREVIGHLAARIQRVQDRLGRRIAVENVSSYVSFADDAMPEWEFLTAVAEAADCGILLDVNNVFVSAHNHGFAAETYVDSVPAERVFQIHLAGHSEQGPLLIDSHDHPVRDEVWALYERTLRRIGPVSTLIEWDDDIPEFDHLVREAERARAIADRVLGEEGDFDPKSGSVGAGADPATDLATDHRA
ncbi:MAG: DUF692 domain-containing protein [Myxococcota bacterium]